MKKTLFTLILSIAAPLLFGGNSTLSSYLLIDSFPEVSAKGSASGAASYGVYNSDVNPAAGAGVENFGFAAMHSVLPLNIFLDKITVVKYFDFGCVGLNLTYIDFGSYDAVGIDENLYPVYTGLETSSYSMYGSILYSKKFEGFSIGIAGKLINENLSHDSYYQYAFDAGFIIENIILDDLNLGMSVCNISTNDGDYHLPIDVKAGFSYNIKNRIRDIIKITASTNYIVYEQAINGGLGFDYSVIDELVLRGGFTVGNKQDLKFTAGLAYKTGGTTFAYAFTPDSIETKNSVAGDTHKFSISGIFGKEQETTEKPDDKGGESFGGYMQSGNYYYEAKQYRQAIKYYEYINLLYWKETEEMKDSEKSAFFQRMGISYYNIRDNRKAKQYFERALYFSRDNEILKHWIKSLK